MLPFWDPQFLLRQLDAMIAMPQTGRPVRRGLSAAAKRPGVRCGCCPRCHEFVRIDLRRPGETVPCPSCRWPIGFVQALDADTPSLE